jgi:hypothetical protein
MPGVTTSVIHREIQECPHCHTLVCVTNLRFSVSEPIAHAVSRGKNKVRQTAMKVALLT